MKQLQFLWSRLHQSLDREAEPKAVAGVDILFRRNPLAKRYRLYVDRSGQPRVTIPRRGTLGEARIFAEQHRAWILGQLEKLRSRRSPSQHWNDGTPVLFRGEQCHLRFQEVAGRLVAHLGTDQIELPADALPGSAAIRLAVEAHLRKLAEQELPCRLHTIATALQSVVSRVSIRNQRTRWGSCSRRGTISLNWRLIQLPDFVRDYIIIHELMHLREMNHSARYWKHVEAACPNYLQAEAWLKANPGLLSTPE